MELYIQLKASSLNRNIVGSKARKASAILNQKITGLASVKSIPLSDIESNDGSTESLIGPDGPQNVKEPDESQCVISPSLMGILSMFYRTDDVCVAAIAYFLKAETDLVDDTIRTLLPFVCDHTLGNKMCTRRIRKTLVELDDDRTPAIKHALTYFIMNTIDPVSGTRISLDKPDKSETPDPKKEKASNTSGLAPQEPTNRKWSLFNARKSSTAHLQERRLSRRLSYRMSSTFAIKKALSNRASLKVAPTAVVSPISPLMLRQDGKNDKKRIVSLGNLQVAVGEDDLEPIFIQARTTDSVIDHALKMKAESIEAAEAVFLLTALADMSASEINENDRKWEAELMKEELQQLKIETSGKRGNSRRGSRRPSKKLDSSKTSASRSDDSDSPGQDDDMPFTYRIRRGTRDGSRRGTDTSDVTLSASEYRTQRRKRDDSWGSTDPSDGTVSASASGTPRRFITKRDESKGSLDPSDGTVSASASGTPRRKRDDSWGSTDPRDGTVSASASGTPRRKRDESKGSLDPSDGTVSASASGTSRRGPKRTESETRRLGLDPQGGSSSSESLTPGLRGNDEEGVKTIVPGSRRVDGPRALRHGVSPKPSHSGSLGRGGFGSHGSSSKRERHRERHLKSSATVSGQSIDRKVFALNASEHEIYETLVGGETIATYVKSCKKPERKKTFSDIPPTPITLDQGPEVKKYLEAKGIHKIFESLMVNLLTDLPSQPLDYLINLTGHMNKLNQTKHEIEAKEVEMWPHSGSGVFSKGNNGKATSISDIGSSYTSLRRSKDSLPPVDA